MYKNNEGYIDKTAYFAIKNAEKKKATKVKSRRLTYKIEEIPDFDKSVKLLHR